MKHRFTAAAVTAIGLLFSANLYAALEQKSELTREPSVKHEGIKPAAGKPEKGSMRGPDATNSLIDINSATVAELKKLPGISDALAANIVASRPYGSKAQLVTKNILDPGLYEGLRRQLIAKQANAGAAKSASAKPPKQ